MDRYAAGDDAAFSEIYDLLAPRVFSYLRRQVRENSRAEDLLQQTLMQIHRGRASFMSGSEVLPWAFGIARRLLIDDIRRNKRQVRLVDEADPSAIAGVCSHMTTDGPAEARQLAERMQRVLDRLPDMQRIAFEMVKQDGLSLAETAEILDTTVAAVKLRTHRAYEALREVLGDEIEDERGARPSR